MTKTPRLHYDDPLALELEVTVLDHSLWGKTPSVICDRTPFYPESGGQLGDRGTLGDAQVVDVQVDGDGLVHHLVESAPPPAATQVLAQVDASRRREHMALHTGQHALSRALLDELGAVTVSSRLGASGCTIDVDLDGLTLDALRPVEDVVNALIDEDRPVRQRFVTEAELGALTLRKPPPAADRVRVVEIDGFDITPCGGTHTLHTAQIELLWIRSVERYKGGTRITFEAGPRARRGLRESHERLVSIAKQLRCAPPEVGDIVDGLREKLDGARAEAGTLRGALADTWAAALGERSTPLLAELPGADPALLKAVADRLATGDRLVALVAPGDGGSHLIVARGPDSEIHSGQLLGRIMAAHGGRGGGRPQLAQGRLPAGAALTEADLER